MYYYVKLHFMVWWYNSSGYRLYEPTWTGNTMCSSINYSLNLFTGDTAGNQSGTWPRSEVMCNAHTFPILSLCLPVSHYEWGHGSWQLMRATIQFAPQYERVQCPDTHSHISTAHTATLVCVIVTSRWVNGLYCMEDSKVNAAKVQPKETLSKLRVCVSAGRLAQHVDDNRALSSRSHLISRP